MSTRAKPTGDRHLMQRIQPQQNRWIHQEDKMVPGLLWRGNGKEINATAAKLAYWNVSGPKYRLHSMIFTGHGQMGLPLPFAMLSWWNRSKSAARDKTLRVNGGLLNGPLPSPNLISPKKQWIKNLCIFVDRFVANRFEIIFLKPES